VNAAIGVVSHPEQADAVEEGIDRSQGADDPAERAPVQDGRRHEEDEKRNFPAEEDPGEIPEPRFKSHHGETGLEGAGGTDEFTEPGNPITEFVHHEKGEQ